MTSETRRLAGLLMVILPSVGGVTARFGPREKPPLEVLRAWIDQSYRAVARKATSR
jgi:hypothetical protein